MVSERLFFTCSFVSELLLGCSVVGKHSELSDGDSLLVTWRGEIGSGRKGSCPLCFFSVRVFFCLSSPRLVSG